MSKEILSKLEAKRENLNKKIKRLDKKIDFNLEPIRDFIDAKEEPGDQIYRLINAHLKNNLFANTELDRSRVERGLQLDEVNRQIAALIQPRECMP